MFFKNTDPMPVFVPICQCPGTASRLPCASAIVRMEMPSVGFDVAFVLDRLSLTTIYCHHPQPPLSLFVVASRRRRRCRCRRRRRFQCRHRSSGRSSSLSSFGRPELSSAQRPKIDNTFLPCVTHGAQAFVGIIISKRPCMHVVNIQQQHIATLSSRSHP